MHSTDVISASDEAGEQVWFAGGGTGGHLYPGLAIARALVRVSSARPFFVGAKRGIEREILPTTEFPYVLLDLHPLYRQNCCTTGAQQEAAFRQCNH